jgi:hypothetical protein
MQIFGITIVCFGLALTTAWIGLLMYGIGSAVGSVFFP